MLKASFAFSVMTLSVRMASSHLSSVEIVFFRSLIGTGMILALMHQKKTSLWGRANQRKIMILRGLSGFAALILFFHVIAKLPLGTAVLLNYSSPIFAAILASFFLKERVTFSLLGIILVAFSGLSLLVNAQFGAWTKDIWLGLLSAVFAAIAYVSIRAIKHRESPLTIIFYFTGISTVGSLFFLHHFEWPSAVDWFYLTGVGIGSFFGQLWMTISLRRARASLVGPFSYLAPFLAFLYGLLFFGEAMSWKAWLGAVLMIMSGIYITYFETKKKIQA